MTDKERSQCHARPKGSMGHQVVGPANTPRALEGTCHYCNRPVVNVVGVWMLKKGETQIPEQPTGKLVFIDAAGQVTSCDRCGDPCRVAERRNPNSAPFRLSEKPKGFCANCVMTQFLYNTYPVNWQIDEAGPTLLLKPGVREAFLSSGLLDGCDLDIAEINWAKVVAHWSLPVAIAKSGKNPYRMGESPKSHLRSNHDKPDSPESELSKKWGSILNQNNGVLSGEEARAFMEETGLRGLIDETKGRVQ